MKETLELRVNLDYAHMLFKSEEGKYLGTSIKIIELSKKDPRYNQIPLIAKQVQDKYNRSFFFGWKIKRKYSNEEYNSANLFHLKIKTTFEPAGEECGTLYDETETCKICGVNRKQINRLHLKYSSIPKKDIARTISGEVIVSEKFVNSYKERGLKGAKFEPVVLNGGRSKYYQLDTSTEIELSKKTVAGINPFNLSTSNEGEVYKCPYNHTIGLNILSEPCVLRNSLINDYDFFASKQRIGVKRGLLRPNPVYLCTSEFEIAHIDDFE
jgi:hypothetical protein